MNSKRLFPIAPEDSRRILHLLLIHSQRITLELSRSRLHEAVQLLRILYENTMARCFVRSPVSEQVEQHGIVWRSRFVGVRPVAAPYHALRRSLYICSTNLVHVRVAAQVILCIELGCRGCSYREFDPCPALVNQSANNCEGRVFHTVAQG